MANNGTTATGGKGSGAKPVTGSTSVVRLGKDCGCLATKSKRK